MLAASASVSTTLRRSAKMMAPVRARPSASNATRPGERTESPAARTARSASGDESARRPSSRVTASQTLSRHNSTQPARGRSTLCSACSNARNLYASSRMAALTLLVPTSMPRNVAPSVLWSISRSAIRPGDLRLFDSQRMAAPTRPLGRPQAPRVRSFRSCAASFGVPFS